MNPNQSYSNLAKADLDGARLIEHDALDWPDAPYLRGSQEYKKAFRILAGRDWCKDGTVTINPPYNRRSDLPFLVE